METLKETTPDLLPHTYLVKGDKMFAYRRDSGEINVFTRPLSFSKRYRKFKKVVDNELERSYTIHIDS